MITLAIVVVFCALAYYYSTKSFKYWDAKGIKHDKPIPLFGNCFWYYLKKRTIAELAHEVYNKYPNEKVVGFFRVGRPELVVRDPEIIKRILVTDFVHFNSRDIDFHEEVLEPMMRNLFFARGDLWRLLRQCMTPIFTSVKLKMMFPLIVEMAEKLQARAFTAAAAGHTIDAYDLVSRYNIDFIGSCGFGLDINALSEEDSAFKKLGVKIFQVTARDLLVNFLNIFIPCIGKQFKYFERIESDILKLTKQMLDERNYELSGRNDFIDMLLECKKKGPIVVESIERRKPDGSPDIATLELDDVHITAQIFTFFAAGFETTSSAISYVLHQLAYNPEIQIEIQKEVDEVLTKYNDKLSYDAIKEMTYLNCALKEGLRLFPPGGVILRQCVRRTPIPELNMSLEKDDRIIIPVNGLHNDPKYFEKPHEFRPKRFISEEFGKTNKYAYLPFGAGPRACTGERLGVMQSLAGLAAILSKFTVVPAPESKEHPETDHTANFVQAIKGGLPLLFKERNMHIQK
ncbi:cytochrome P450 6B5-like [Achroia grisella]|uniref:cytochrome P450 6B5-like n=1 Tax=Achroia grisella TaxID=688607 RepID=UPI0027D31702|nr:cytochrome P450 6B5-like [Achroia grisella]